MTRAGPVEIEDEINRLAAESLAVRTILAHMLSHLSAIASPDIAVAVRRGLEDAERALKDRASLDAEALTPAGFAMALSAVENLKSAALGQQQKPGAGLKETPAAFHAESNDRWPEDDY